MGHIIWQFVKWFVIGVVAILAVLGLGSEGLLFFGLLVLIFIAAAIVVLIVLHFYEKKKIISIFLCVLLFPILLLFLKMLSKHKGCKLKRIGD